MLGLMIDFWKSTIFFASIIYIDHSKISPYKLGLSYRNFDCDNRLDIIIMLYVYKNFNYVSEILSVSSHGAIT